MRISNSERAVGVLIATGVCLTATTAFALTGSAFTQKSSTPTETTELIHVVNTEASTTTTTTTTIPLAVLQEQREIAILTRPYTWREQSESVRELQTLIGAEADGLYGKYTREAHIKALEARGLDTSTVPAIPVSTYSYGDRQCPQWEDLARSVGWPEEQIKKFSYAVYKESRCNPEAHNPNDPTWAGSRGLMQINGYWCIPNKYNPDGWLQQQGILSTCDDLYNPEINLRAGLAIWQRSGWSPWSI